MKECRLKECRLKAVAGMHEKVAKAVKDGKPVVKLT